MKPLSADTPLEVEKIWLDAIRARGPQFQLERMIELSNLCREGARKAIERAMPEASPAERDERLLIELYGDPEAARAVVELRRQLGFYEERARLSSGRIPVRG